MIQINCKIFTPDGKKAQVHKVTYKSNDVIRVKDFPGEKFDKTDIEYIDLLIEKFQPGLENAIDELVEKLLVKA